MSKEIEIDVTKVKVQDKNGKKGDEEGKPKKVTLKKNDDDSINIGGQKITKIKRESDKEKKKDTLTGTTIVVVEDDGKKKEYEMSVEVTIDCSVNPALMTTIFKYWGTRFKEVDEISHEEQKKLLGWLDENKVLGMLVLPSGYGLPPPGLTALAYLSPDEAADPVRLGTIINEIVKSAVADASRSSILMSSSEMTIASPVPASSAGPGP